MTGVKLNAGSREALSLLRFATSAIKIAIIGITAIAVLSAGFWFFNYYRDRTSDKNVGQAIVITIKEDQDSGDVAKQLEKYDLINFPIYFETMMRVQNKDLVPGTYRLEVGMTTGDIISAITTDKSTAKTENKDLTVTIPEGYRIGQIADAVDKAGINGGRQAFLSALETFDYSGYDFLKDLPKNGPKSEYLEGFLFPDTYNFKSDDPPEYLIQSMLDNFNEKFTDKMRQQASDQGMSVRDVVTLASIVEREAAISDERPIIASLYLNRMAIDMPLQSDPTVQYVLGKEGDWWPTVGGSDIENTDSTYNTYNNNGLPPGPIANPGLDSIVAVLNPASTDYIYMVAKGDTGEHAFTDNYEEHQRNIAEYQK
jgi:UPF0755 protein